MEGGGQWEEGAWGEGGTDVLHFSPTGTDFHQNIFEAFRFPNPINNLAILIDKYFMMFANKGTNNRGSCATKQNIFPNV